jgi:hypothetical protein
MNVEVKCGAAVAPFIDVCLLIRNSLGPAPEGPDE